VDWGVEVHNVDWGVEVHNMDWVLPCIKWTRGRGA